jgi:hypothetical protein
MRKSYHLIRAVVSAVCIVLITAGASNSSQHQVLPEDSTPISRYLGEELYYRISIAGAELARGALVLQEAEALDEGAGRLLEAYGVAMTEGIAAMVFPLRDEGRSIISAETGLPVTAEKQFNERGSSRSYEVDFNHPRFVAHVVREGNDRVNRYDRSIPSGTYDAYSWIYAIRDQPLNPGSAFVYYVYDGWKLSRITATVGHLEEVLVGSEFIECRRIRLRRDVMGSGLVLPMIGETASLPPALWARPTNAGEQTGEAWISNDERRLPVQIVFQNEVISATATLVDYESPENGYE